MTKVFTSQSLTEVEFFHGLLEGRGIASAIRNQYTGIARGEIPFTDTWPELWVVHDADLGRAQAVVQGRQEGGAAAGGAWTCPDCGEEIEGQFASCWNCSADRPA